MKATFRATTQTGILISGAGVSIDGGVDFVAGTVEVLAPERCGSIKSKINLKN